MAEFKIVIADTKTGKSYQKELKEDNAKGLIGKKIGEKFNGELIDMTGYEFEITGGSDYAGFPMRWDVQGTAIKKIFSTKTMGLHTKDKGIKKKKTFAGNTIYEKTAQVNIKVLKQGSTPLSPNKNEESLEKSEASQKEAPAKEAKSEGDAPAEAPKEKPKAEAKPEEKKPSNKSENGLENPKDSQKEKAPKEEPKAEKPKAEEKKA